MFYIFVDIKKIYIKILNEQIKAYQFLFHKETICSFYTSPFKYKEPVFLLHIITHNKNKIKMKKKTHYDTEESFRTSASAKFERNPRRKKNKRTNKRSKTVN